MNGIDPHHELPRLMIVDDDPGTIRLLIEMLKGLGRIHFATSGTEAIEMARSVGPDLILLDVEMPEPDGFHVCEQIKADPAFEDVPILFVTSHGDVEIEARALSAGAIDFISKPPHPLVVRARVTNYLALKQRTDQLRRLSTVDGLTGVANRRAFDAALEMEWRRACRTGEPLALLMLDVDFFKRFNDTYGHQAGDECLRGVAATLSASVRRPGELAVRYGGEEFAALLPACNAEQAMRSAEVIRAGVAALQIPHAASDVAPHVTISVGLASMSTLCTSAHPEPRGKGSCAFKDSCRLGPADLIRMADEALYAAKRGGRNKVETLTAHDTSAPQTLLCDVGTVPH